LKGFFRKEQFYQILSVSEPNVICSGKLPCHRGKVVICDNLRFIAVVKYFTDVYFPDLIFTDSVGIEKNLVLKA
jgi:hypothetical protein